METPNEWEPRGKVVAFNGAAEETVPKLPEAGGGEKNLGGGGDRE